MTAHEWDAMAACLTEDVVRIGPYRDRYDGRAAYVEFILPALPGYSMEITRITDADGGRLAFAELSETVTVEGAPLRTDEVLVFELTDDDRIVSIDVFIKTSAPG
jgi:hypothetical protein